MLASSHLQNIAAFPKPVRHFLLFTAINVVSWQCIAGQALVLFARAAGMPPFWVGVLLSFLPLSSVLVACAVPLVEWAGPRRLIMSTWLARNLVATAIFVMPWLVASWGSDAGWRLLLAVTLAFSLMRAIGVGGWYPWLHEIVPRAVLGSYFAVETAMTQLISILLAFAMAWTLAGGEGVDRYFWIYGAGITAGLGSVLLVGRIPGGAGLSEERRRAGGGASLKVAFRDRDYLQFLGCAMLGLVSVMWQNAASVMYLRDVLLLSDTVIMLYLAGAAVAVAATVHFWGGFADRFGSVPAMIQVLFAHCLFAAAWLALFPGTSASSWAALPVLTGTTVFQSAFSMVAARGMLCRVREEGKVGYTSLWMMCSALATGLPPVLAGSLIGGWGLQGFRSCFAVAAVAGGVTVALLFRLAPEEGKPPVHALHHIIRPSQPLRSLGRIFWITLGLGGRE